MMEIFDNISEEIRETAEVAWNLALLMKKPEDSAELLNSTINYYKNILTEEEIEFLQFYFNMKMELMKE